jgi:NAD-dependent deacetylase
MSDIILEAVKLIEKSKYITAFTGAGISVESGIAPFRGENGIWNKYEEKLFDIDYFSAHTKETWDMLCDGFYEGTLKAKPNSAHIFLARLEKEKNLKSVITQNIDNLHQKAGSETVYELHGNAIKLTCLKDGSKYDVFDFDLKSAPLCKKCKSILKPDFVFFGEQLPQYDFNHSINDSRQCDLMIIIGSTGIVYPAASIPNFAKENGAKIIEINPQHSSYTKTISDIYIPLKAAEATDKIENILFKNTSLK